MNKMKQHYEKLKEYPGWSKKTLIPYAFAIIVSGFVVVNAAASPGHDHGEEISGSHSEFPIVTVRKVASADVANIDVSSIGTVLAKQDSVVHPKREGIIQDLYVDVGSRVYAGQVVGLLEPSLTQSELYAQLQQEQAELRGLHKQYDILLNGSENIQGSRLDREIKVLDEFLSSEKKGAESENTVYEADIQSIITRLSILQKKRQQLTDVVRSALYDLVDAGGSILYTETDFKRVVLNEDKPHLYRRSLYVHAKEEFIAARIGFKKLYQQLESGDDTIGLLGQAIDVGRDIRSLATKFRSDVDNSPSDIAAFRKDLDKAIDHLLSISNGIVDIESEEAELDAKQKQISADFEHTKTSRDADITKLDQEKDIVSLEFDKKLESIKQEISVQEARVNGVSVQIGVGRRIVAPFSGVVTRRFVSVGDSVSLDNGLFELIDDSEIFVRFRVAEEDIPLVSMDTVIEFAAQSNVVQKHKATIKRMSPALDKETGTMLVEAELDEMYANILPNMTVSVQVPVQAPDGSLVVSDKSVQSDENGSFVWVVNNEVQAEKKSVEILFSRDDVVVVSSEDLTVKHWSIVDSSVPLKDNLDVETEIDN